MKLGRKLFYGLCLGILAAMPVHAYLDPSVATFTIQVIAGVAVAVGAVAGILWRKAKKKVAEKLHLEEKSIKETEGEVTLIDDEEEI